MSLHPVLLNNVVRITSAGDMIGSGSIVSVRSESGSGIDWPYLVTAHHVIRSQVVIEIDVPDPARRDELQKGIVVDNDQWRQPIPGVDLAVAPFPHDKVDRWQAFSMETQFVDDGVVVPLGGTVHYLGIFAPPDVPMARTGTIGAYDVVIEKTENGHRYSYNADLLDCRSYKGFSGSPCLGTLTYAVIDRPVPLPAGVPLNPDGSEPKLVRTASLASFCGMLTSHYSDEQAVDADGAVSRYGVCVMLPALYVRVALTDEIARTERHRWDTEGRPPCEGRE